MAKMKRVIAILETMWDWRGMTSEAGYRQAPRFFRINPQNHSGRRLYKLIGPHVRLLVTNACKELGGSADDHGVADPVWLRINLEELERHGFDLLLVCGKVAQGAFKESGYQPRVKTLEIPHPAARVWTKSYIAKITRRIQVGYSQTRKP